MYASSAPFLFPHPCVYGLTLIASCSFCSLHQNPPGGERTPAEAMLFGTGLSASNIWYGHMKTVVWMQPQLPEGFCFASHLAQSYETSGWCHVEAAISAVVTHGKRRLDLSVRQGHEISIYDNNNKEVGVDLVPTCAAHRPVPTLPDTMAWRLEHELVFTNGKSDADKVAALYRSFFDAVAPSVERLNFARLRWGTAEVEALAVTMPSFSSCTSLDLAGITLGAEGAKALAPAIAANA